LSSNTVPKLTAACVVVLLVGSIQAAVAEQAAGSLIDADEYRALTADRHAHQVGDVLTVVVVETSHAVASANTDAENDLRLNGTLRGRLGPHDYGVGLSGTNQGAGQTSRAGTLQAQLAVRVVSVERDGMLRVRGAQTVEINGERQRIALQGLVRETDIQASNMVPSNRISDAQIEFTGRGDVSEAQRHSILYKVMKWLRLL
jgi:flagellar L-ring protein precursor FlgH